MITLENFDDVLDLLNLIGGEGLKHYYHNCRNFDHCDLIRSTKKYAMQTTFYESQINDGNIIIEEYYNVDLADFTESAYFNTMQGITYFDDMTHDQRLKVGEYFLKMVQRQHKFRSLINIDL